MNTAFLLGAGMGTRLRPLTDVLPKPLIPVLNKPLITYAFDLLQHAGVEQFIVNTHHLAGAWERAFPGHTYDGVPIRFVREEPEILETGGGLANAAPLLQDGPFIVFNGDILTNLPLEPALIAHRTSGNLVTLLLRSLGPNPNVHWDPAEQKVRDLRGILQTDCPTPVQFTGIYLAEPEFLAFLQPRPESVIPAFIRVIQEQDRLGGILVDDGFWRDLGDRESYLEASARVADLPETFIFKSTLPPVRIHPSARIDPSAKIDLHSSVGPHCLVGPDCSLENSILWENASLAPSVHLTECVVSGNAPVPSGVYHGQDL